ncbi:hypothetical protein GCM10010331_26680 [Streptomyces xanthochromogenes]|uniref:hypothetical protein n=1 Tax=Streptomyces xanthochromogenes TaxID=67384 RepID=UPI0016797B71|nr:hypothetical protein [Streptomyces xanthochromogenes]GHB37880.1 hypothetical protein GCM10010331_26680 [Streptomyces xanthochromogenes]
MLWPLHGHETGTTSFSGFDEPLAIRPPAAADAADAADVLDAADVVDGAGLS